MNAGNYKTRLQHLVRSPAKNTTIGAEEDAFAPAHFLWSDVQYTSGRRVQEYGAYRPGVFATIKVRNQPALSALDRLKNTLSGEVFVIETITPGDNELICDCYRWDI